MRASAFKPICRPVRCRKTPSAFAHTEIVESIKKVAEIVADIANASAEQATGTEQVNKALTQMDEVTQQNSAPVEENAATAKTLEHQAKVMDERVAFFGSKTPPRADTRHSRGMRANSALSPPCRRAVRPPRRNASRSRIL
jgi:methyl-accepting chemotaxis protein